MELNSVKKKDLAESLTFTSSKRFFFNLLELVKEMP